MCDVYQPLAEYRQARSKEAIDRPESNQVQLSVDPLDEFRLNETSECYVKRMRIGMSIMRRLEVVSGAGVAVLGAAGIVASLALPTAMQRGTALDARGNVLSVQTTQMGFLQQVGMPLGIAVLTMLGVLALCIATVSLARGGRLSLATLLFLWALVGLLTYAALAATVALGPNFWPSAALGVICAVLATVQLIQQPGQRRAL
jgi:hypothetical protein